MKIFSIFALTILLSSFAFGQSVTINDVTMASSFNDFAAVKVSVDITIGYASAYALAKYSPQYWDGDSWENANEKQFWTPETPVIDLDYTEDVYITTIPYLGNGSFRLYIYAYADYVTDDDGWHNFTVTDITAPGAPILSLDTSGDHPILSWNKPASDVKNYKTYRKSGQYGSWVHRATVTGLTWTETNITLDMPDTHYYFKVQAVDYEENVSNDSNIEDCWGLHKRPVILSAVNNEQPTDFILKSNYPNPFNPTTTIEFDLPEDGHTNLIIFNLNGQQVANLINSSMAAGSYKVRFNAENLPSGVYFYQLSAGEYRDIKRMLLIK